VDKSLKMNSTELDFRYRMCDLHSKFEENPTKTVVIIVDDFGQTDRHTDRQSKFIYVQCHALH